jgi:hypothetical protein
MDPIKMIHTPSTPYSPMDLVEEYYRTGRLGAGCAVTCSASGLCGSCAADKLTASLPPMTPPPGEIVFVYELRNPIDSTTATLVWSFFSESHGIFLTEKGPYTRLLCTKLVNIPEVHKKMAEFSKHYDLRCFDSVYILPGCIMEAHIE